VNPLTLSEIELLQSNPEEKAIFTSYKFVSFRKKVARIRDLSLPKYCIMGFFPSLYTYIKKKYRAVVLDVLNKKHPYYLFDRNGKKMVFIFPGIGAPLAGALLDETIGLGASHFIVMGTAGLLQKEPLQDELIIPTAAVRDEGTSFHYEKPGRYTHPDQDLVDTIINHFHSRHIPYRKGITWTTDGPYRETPSKIRRLRQEGCICVDMEASALFSIAKHYQKKIACIFMATDRVTEDKWYPKLDSKNISGINPAKLFEMTADVFDHFNDF
jgi:uridine phosphorylase